MSSFKCPKITNVLDRQYKKIFWGSDVKTPPVAWKHVCKPKSIGGLGLRPASHFSNSALAKLGWKILTDHNNWWVQIVRKKVLKKI